jgi:CubicO group peptidase (beta-lactamase class C family)
MKKMLISLLVVLVVLSVGLYAFAPHAPSTPKQEMNTAELETYLNQLVVSGNPPRLSVVVVRDGEVVYNNAFGFADGPRKVKATPDTVYHWWSMTKIPTALAIMQLQEQGKLVLDDEVTKVLPWFEVKYPRAPARHHSPHLLAALFRAARSHSCHDRLGALHKHSLRSDRSAKKIHARVQHTAVRARHAGCLQ